jgi:hypothetical protein
LPSATPAATGIGTARHDHLHLCQARNVRKPGPVRCPRGRVRRPQWTPQSDRFRTPPAPWCPAGHHPLHPARHGEPKAMRTGNGRTARKAFGHPRSHDHRCGPPDTPCPLLWGRRLRLGNQGRLGDGKTANATVITAATRQLLGVTPPFRPRLGALLSSDDYGSSVERNGGGHPLCIPMRTGKSSVRRRRSQA